MLLFSNFTKGFLCTCNLFFKPSWAQSGQQFYMIINDYLRMQGELVTECPARDKIVKVLYLDDFAQYSIDASLINRHLK